MILRLCIDLFFKFCIFSILIDNLRCYPVFEKFTKKYWFDKRELENFGENIKGIKVVQDEFRIGIISHLPEVKRYLQREMLENVARRRKNLEDQYYIGRTIQETAPPKHSKILWDAKRNIVEDENEVKIVDGNKVEIQSPSSRVDEKRRQNIRKRAVSGEVPEGEANHIVTINEKRRIADNIYNRKNFESCKERVLRKIEYDEEDDDGEETDDEYSNVDSIEANKLNDKIDVTLVYKNLPNSLPFVNCSDSDHENEMDEEDDEDEMDDVGSNITEKLANSKGQEQTKGIFKTNISLLAIWFVCVSLMVCLLTCGCFSLFVACFDDNHETVVPFSMPLKHVLEYSE